MSNLLFGIIALVLIISLSVGGSSYVNTSLIGTKQNEQTVKSSLVQMIADYHVYKMNNNETMPPSNGWTQYITKRRSPVATDWHYSTDGDKSYFCLSGEFYTQNEFNSIKNMLNNNFNSVFINNSCGSTTSDISFSDGDTKAFTIWLDSNYTSSIDVDSSISPSFEWTLTNSETKSLIYNEENITAYESEDLVLEVYVSNPNISISFSNLENTDISFVCSNGVIGCDENLKNRYIKITPTNTYSNQAFSVYATSGNTEKEITINLEAKYRFVCDPTDPLNGFYSESGAYLIGNSVGYSSIAKKQLLCLSKYQNIVGNTGNPMNASYKMTADVEFDIDFDIEESTTNEFLTNLTPTVNSNNEDWDLDGEADNTNTIGFVPLGTSSNPFSGNFNGNGHYIRNLYINNIYDYQGFFGIIENADITDLEILNTYISGNNCTGILAGYSSGSNIDLIHTTGNVLSTGNYAGGIIGRNNSTIENSYSETNIFSSNNYIGGLVGQSLAASTIQYSYYSGKVTGNDYVGGLIGNSISGANINNNYSIGYNSGNSNVGGLVGYNQTTSLEKCHSNSHINGTSNIGSLIGSSSVSVTKSYAINNEYTAISNLAYDSDNYCSHGYDYGCQIDYSVGSIKDGWEDNIWEDLAEDSPILEWQVNGDISSNYQFSCNILHPLTQFSQDNDGYYLIGGESGDTELAQKQLLCMSQNQTSEVLSSNYKLTANINFSSNMGSIDWDGDSIADGVGTEGWISIGNSATPFTGIFDGNEHFIKYIYRNVNSSNTIYSGFFGYTDGATIKNLSLNNLDINSYSSSSSYNYGGGLIGYANNTIISDINLSGTLHVETSGWYRLYGGGAISYLQSSNIRGVQSSVNVILKNTGGANYSYTGGLIGMGELVEIYQCSSTGDVTNNSSGGNRRVGGLVGNLNGNINQSFYSGNINSNGNYVGGLVGYVDSSEYVKDSYSKGNIVSTGYYIGGLIGDPRNAIISNCYTSTNITNNSGGAILGNNIGNKGSITKSYAINDTLSPIPYVTSNANEFCSYTKDITCLINYSQGSIKTYWSDAIWEDLADNNPKLEWENAGYIDSEIDDAYFVCNTDDPLSGFIPQDGYYLIGNSYGDEDIAKNQLLCLSNNQNAAIMSANYKMTANVNFNNYSSEDWNNDGTIDGSNTYGWNPLGTSSIPFSGIWDGDGHSITNLYINQSWNNYKGLFGATSSAMIKNLYFEDTSIVGGNYTGTLVGYADSTDINNVGSYSTYVNGNSYTGGLVGYSNNMTLTTTSSSGTIIGLSNYAGGIVGYSDDGVHIYKSYSSASIANSYGGSGFGGVVGYMNRNGVVGNCYATGNIDTPKWGGNYVGGLVGYMNNGSSVYDSYSTSKINAGSYVGGLVGYIKNNGSSITNSYALWSTAPYGNSSVGGLVGYNKSATISNKNGLCEYVQESSPTACTISEALSIQKNDLRLISDGNNDYINTGLNWNSTTRIRIEGNLKSGITNMDKITGTLNNYTWIGVRDGKFYFGQGGTTFNYGNNVDYDNHVFTIDLINNIISIDSNEYLYTGDKPNNIPLFLFARENGGSPLQYVPFSLSNAQIWQNGDLVRDFSVKSNGTLYDSVNDVSYSNSGSGSFSVSGEEGWDSSVWNNIGSDATPILK